MCHDGDQFGCQRCFTILTPYCIRNDIILTCRILYLTNKSLLYIEAVLFQKHHFCVFLKHRQLPECSITRDSETVSLFLKVNWGRASSYRCLFFLYDVPFIP